MATQGGRRSQADDERILACARALVARGWCRNALAEDRYGRQVEPWAHEAVRWSALGALLRGAWDEGALDHFATAYFALAAATGGRLAEWNAAPWRTSRHVARAFLRAREYLPAARDEVLRRRAAALSEAVAT
jgi:hypothetical protein